MPSLWCHRDVPLHSARQNLDAERSTKHLPVVGCLRSYKRGLSCGHFTLKWLVLLLTTVKCCMRMGISHRCFHKLLLSTLLIVSLCLCHSIVTTTTQQQLFYGPLSGTTRVSRYEKKHSPTHHPGHHPIFISFFHLPRSIASSLFKLRAWRSFSTTSFHVLFGLPLGLEPSTSYSIHFFTQSVSSFRSTCPYHCKLFSCSITIILFIPGLSLTSLLGTQSFALTLHIHLAIGWLYLST